MAKKLSWIGWIGSLLIAIALINWGTVFYFDFNIVEWLSFGMRWLAGTIYTIVTVLGLWALVELLVKLFK